MCHECIDYQPKLLKTLAFIISSLFVITSYSRDLHLEPMLGSKSIELHKPIIYGDDTVKITTFKLYISFQHKSHYPTYLFDIEKTPSCTIPEHSERLQFGIDSMQTINTDFSGALDPIHGMFWTWNAGYINCKIEGIFTHANNVRTEFQLHLGGYRFPHATAHVMNIPKGKKDIQIEIDIKPALDQMMKEGKQRIMMPGKDAKVLSDLLYSSIRISY